MRPLPFLSLAMLVGPVTAQTRTVWTVPDPKLTALMPGGPPVSGLTAQPGTSNIYLRWTCPAGASGFEVYATPRGGTQVKLTATPLSPNCVQDPAFATASTLTSSTLTGTSQTTYSSGFNHTGIYPPGSEFTYVVRTLYPSGGPADSNPLVAHNNLYPAVTEVRVYNGGCCGVTVTWKANGSASYLVFRRLAGETTLRQIAAIGPLTTFTNPLQVGDGNLPPGRHEYMVRAVDGDPGPPVTVAAGGPAVWGINADMVELDIGFSGQWPGSTVRVEASGLPAGPFTDVTAEGAFILDQHWKTIATPGKTLYYKVVASYAGTRLESAVVPVTYPAAPPITNFTAVGAVGNIYLRWDCAEEVMRYRFMRRDGTGVYKYLLGPTGDWPAETYSIQLRSGEVRCDRTDNSLPAGIGPKGLEYIVIGTDKWDRPLRIGRTIAILK